MFPKVYFQQIDRPVKAQDAIANVYHQPKRDSVDLLKRINNISGKEYFYPGQLMCVPGSEGVPEHSISTLQETSAALAYSNRNSLRAPAPRHFNENFEKYLFAQKEDIGVDVLGKFADGRSKLIETTVSQIKNDLRQLNTLLVKSASRAPGVPQGVPKFSMYDAQKAQIMQRLRESMRVIPKGFDVMKANASTAEDALGISHTAVKRAFRTTGAQTELKQIRQAIATADDAARATSNSAKYLGVSLQVLMGAKTIYDHVSPDGSVRTAQRLNPKSADIIELHATGKDIGGVAGSYAGGLVGAGVATLLLSNPVGWAGLAVVGIAAVAGGIGGGYIGSEGGGMAASTIMRTIDPSRTKEINMIVSEGK